MGSVGSKSPLERRNTVARRSQRRTIHNMKPKIDKVFKDIKKFKGTTEDVNYMALKHEIEYLKNDLTRRGKDLQPQIRNLYESIYRRICEAEEALATKLDENREKIEKKEPKQTEDQQQEEEQLENSQEKRKTVELKFVQVIPDPAVPPEDVQVRSPDEKRKSILKVGGVQVLPGTVMGEMANSTLKRHVKHQQDQPPLTRINQIIQELQNFEMEISQFVGKRNGKQFNKIKEVLDGFMTELSHMVVPDEFTMEQQESCRTYIGSCLSFLEERAVDDAKRESFSSDDEVFDNNNISNGENSVEANFKLQQLLKNTAV